ncbi:putative cation-transporting ATPase 13A1 [Trichinella patagoniensis]|uniref:Putative cation-transporting ATPase 13A1 n=1 Tax=Trichinella patagoniensis TaxID=990121 RepID=A0A0V1AGD5_9BILA|nr:putative cation-transporting ATPase 13A1 [Trichinella patagoniensis]
MCFVYFKFNLKFKVYFSDNAMMIAADELVDHVRLYNPKPLLLHGYIAPFILAYGTSFFLWSVIYGFFEYFELFCIVFSVIGFLQIIVVLLCFWSISARCLLTCSETKDPFSAQLIKVQPTPNNGCAELIPLHHHVDPNNAFYVWFEFQKSKYVYDALEKRRFEPVKFPENMPFQFYKEWKGYVTEGELKLVASHLGTNTMEMVISTFAELFQERATAPFFVFQVFCVCLWCLEEFWYYALFTLFMLVMFEITVVKQQLNSMQEIRSMGNKPYLIYAYRNTKWAKISTEELVSGDLVSIGRSSNENAVPCDILLLRGSCIVDESLLTGESVPQMKESIEDCDLDHVLDINADGRLHVLFGGTHVVQHAGPTKTSSGLKAPNNGCIGYVLRTGFSTSQGKLLRTILFGVKRLTANNRETLFFILFLLVFALNAAIYVWVKGVEDPSRNRYKLFLECILILTSVIPPELPIELSLAVNHSLISLQKLGIFCIEPFRIPLAGKIDVCCFDKTGTLTTDNLIVKGLTGLNGSKALNSIQNAPLESIRVLVSCHSLMQLDAELIGDPLEKACLHAAGWTLTKQDTVIPCKGKEIPVHISHRFHFSSSLQRMSVIASYIPVGSSDAQYFFAVKGSPEILKPMFREPPENYDEIYKQMTLEGARVLALGYRLIGHRSHQEVRSYTRDFVEKELDFAGFVIVSCPLKPDSKEVIREIIDSDHRVTMITGDNPLTACHVAKELEMINDNAVVILEEPTDISGVGGWFWVSLDRSIHIPMIPMQGVQYLALNFTLCMTGSGFAYFYNVNKAFLSELLPYVAVFARMAPKQKVSTCSAATVAVVEKVITLLKEKGLVTLMCGDGTNDVGALKHADVGVALLSHPALTGENRDNNSKKSNESSPSTLLVSNAARNSSTAAADGSQQQHTHSHSRSSSSSSHSHAASRRFLNSKSLVNPTSTMSKVQQALKKYEEEEGPALVRLGDASVAAPFTSKYSSIRSICHIVRQGRCTLVTTLQMFKILALNALLLAYCQSVLNLDGVKFSDRQATVQGLLLAACFFFISRSNPLKTLAKQQPLPNIFNAYTLLSVSAQFIIHFFSLAYLVSLTHQINFKNNVEKANLEQKFQPNLLNSLVYLMSIMFQTCNFAINYRVSGDEFWGFFFHLFTKFKGHPFMESLVENRALLYTLLSAGATVVILTAGLAPDMAEQCELVQLPPELRNAVLVIIAVDVLASYTADKICAFVFGQVKKSTTRQQQLEKK